MKKILYFFIGCAIVGFIGSLVIGTLPAFEMLGTSFLLNIKQGSYPVAYDIFSVDYKQRHDLESFKQQVDQYNFKQYSDVKWLKSVTRPNKTSGYLLGEVAVGDQKIPLEFQFVKTTKNTAKQRAGWYVDDMFIGPEVIQRQIKGYIN
ncbi:hypothetical protein [Candidatus Berkiella aquae]|uniref:Uncharacterized protein n=1 Tax=Candidatus Berkiella aquae TaxID=295108 RepID=A0A0Q9YW60_9GAMM|nr:hypothetical protein [Candidatus Berkiella aquae]MCS5711198.1 hypothetical protein [Candidatus Berkiella aquae]